MYKFTGIPYQKAISKKKVEGKWVSIFLYGTVLCGGYTALVSSFLIEVSHSSYILNEEFLKNFLLRFLLSFTLFSFAGTGFGHWLWTYRNFRLQE